MLKAPELQFAMNWVVAYNSNRCDKMRTLNELEIGKTATVSKLHGEGILRKRIMDMGLTKGCSVTVRKVAPLGDPMEVIVRGYELTLRKCEAELIEIE